MEIESGLRARFYFFNSTAMLTTIIALLITVLPGLIFIHFDSKDGYDNNIEEAFRIRKLIEEDEASRKEIKKISLKEIELRFPFINLLEYYCLKKHLCPYFANDGLTRNDAWQLRMELYREIKKRA